MITTIDDRAFELIDEYATDEARKTSRYEMAEAVRNAAQRVMDNEKQNRAIELRKAIEEGKAAAVELASLGVVGRPVGKTKRKRKDAAPKDAPLPTVSEMSPA